MIIIKNENEIKLMREGGRILAAVLKKLVSEAKPGITTGQLEELACDLIKKAGGRPSFKGYRSHSELKPFPTALCTSINDELVHTPALPSRRVSTGDILSIDVGMEYPYKEGGRGYYTDMAVTVPIGKVSKEAKKLIAATKKSLDLAIKQAVVGKTLGDIGAAVEDYIEAEGYSIVRDLVGHGVGTKVHEDPQVPNFVTRGTKDIKLRLGMTLAIEPMVNIGSADVESGSDGFTIKTADGSLCAHFEHTIAITEKGTEILTI